LAGRGRAGTGAIFNLEMSVLVLLVLCVVSSTVYAVPSKGTPVFGVFSNGTLPKNNTKFPSLEPRIVGGEVMKVPISYQVRCFFNLMYVGFCFRFAQQQGFEPGVPRNGLVYASHRLVSET